jgi:hypothetical protein
MIHAEPHPSAGKTVIIKKNLATNPPVQEGSHYRVEDWLDRLGQGSWSAAAQAGNIACLLYARRLGNNEVLYGKVGSLGHVVHVSEIQPPAAETESEDGNE